jgi:serine/threonine-protein kinase
MVGEGGTATVYRAEHPTRGASAVKILKERMRNDAVAVKRFLREAGYGARVSHPAVVGTFDFGAENGVHYLALEWAPGRPLADQVKESGRLPQGVVVDIIDKLADGLTAAHAQGIIHRDLKPENIIYDPASGSVKLLDFGIARDAQLDAAERLTRTGFFVGTLHYVAPEALSGTLVDEAADIYSLATITYYLLTGRHPYSGRTPRELFQQLLTEPPTPLNEAVPGLRFSADLERAVMRGLSREPKDRQGTVREFADQLTRAPAEPGAPSVTGTQEPNPGLLRSLKSLFGRGRRG